MRDSRTAVAACLLPITRETIVGPLLCQLRDDDWAVLSDVDVYRGGSARIRNRLLSALIQSNASSEFWRIGKIRFRFAASGRR